MAGEEEQQADKEEVPRDSYSSNRLSQVSKSCMPAKRMLLMLLLLARMMQSNTYPKSKRLLIPSTLSLSEGA